MISEREIAAAIKETLLQKYPEYKVYYGALPDNFNRPSYLIECVKQEVSAANRNTFYCISNFTITCLISENSESELGEELLKIQDGVLQLFQAGYIRVEDRALSVKISIKKAEPDRAFVELQLEYCDDRAHEQDNTPLMGDLNLTIREDF